MPLKGKEALKRRMRANANKLARAVGLEALGRIVRRTPVDTGRARANWNTAIGTPDRSNDENRSSSDVQSTLTMGQATIANFGVGQRLFITNSLPYIDELENGSSKQAPQGMVKVTAAELGPLASRAIAQIASGQ